MRQKTPLFSLNNILYLDILIRNQTYIFKGVTLKQMCCSYGFRKYQYILSSLYDTKQIATLTTAEETQYSVYLIA